MSTVPVAKANLKAMMEAWTWPGTAPTIRYGGPTESEDFPHGGELIYFGDIEMQDEWTTLGATRIDEEYELRIVIDVIQHGDDELAAETRAWELYSSLVSLLSANKTLNDAVQRIEGRTVRQTNVPLPSQWLSRITVGQSCIGMIHNP